MAKKKPPASQPPAEPEQLWFGPDDLKTLLRPIDSLSEDPANTRSHDEASYESIASSLRRFGQQKPIVADARGCIRAGNGTLEAARRCGWTHLAIVISDLAGSDLTAYAIADNRTAEKSTWNEQVLAGVLNGLSTEDYPGIDATGFSVSEINAIIEAASKPPPEPPPAQPPEEFSSYDESIETQFKCPSCAYEWSGKPK